MLDLVKDLLEITPTMSQVPLDAPQSIILISLYIVKISIKLQGNRRPFVMETVKADDDAKFGMMLF